MNSTPIASYDAIIIGSGAGGSAAAYRLARAGWRALLLEKRPVLPHDGSILDLNKVIRQVFFLNRETWLDGRFCCKKRRKYTMYMMYNFTV